MSDIGWNHIIVEGFCMRKTSPKKHKYVYEIISINPYKTRKLKNPQYDKNYKTPRKPSYCKNRVTEICLMKECPYLAISETPNKTRTFITDCMKELWDNPYDERWDEE